MDMLAFWLLNPANTILIFLIAAVCYLGWKTQHDRDDVDFADVFRDTNGKVTWTRFAAMGCFITSTWVVISYASARILPNEMLYAYLLTWSGAPVLLEAIRVWSGRPAATEPAPPQGAAANVTVNQNPPPQQP
jgi:hypothetical protein